MSLVKTDKEGRIRKSWLENKSTKRLEKILYKVRLNRFKLQDMLRNLNQFGLDFYEVGLLRHKYLQIESQLMFIISRRGSETLKKIKK